MSYRLCSLEIAFTGSHRTFFEYILVSQELIQHFVPKLKQAVSRCSSGDFSIQYIDDENDSVSVDSEEEFKEFSKLAKQRCLDGKPLKLIVKCEKLPDPRKLASQPEFRQLTAMQKPKGEFDLGLPNSASTLTEECSYITQWKMDFKSELKEEILKELRDELGAPEEPKVASNGAAANEEELYCNLTNLSGKMKERLVHNLKKLEKKEKLAGFEIDHRLEKLEMKRKKLLEKASSRAAYRNPIVDPTIGLPFIMSGIATRDSVSLPKRVTVGKVFVHQWRIINDGTVPWKDVQLVHNWSSPGLEPDELTLKCNPLLPGHEGQLTIKFRAPKIVGSFVTYWHFVYGIDLKQFGHYVSLMGNTKLPKQTSASSGQTKVKDCKNKPKYKTKTVVVNEEANLIIGADKVTKEGAACSSAQSLASSEIAAEMARVAAEALLKRTSEMQADDDLPKKCYEVLNLADSASDTDINVDDNEDTDPEYVMVNIPSAEKTKEKDNNIQSSIGDSTNEKKETNVLQNLNVDGNILLTLQPEAIENDNNINTNRLMEKGVIENATKVDCSPLLETTFYPLNNGPTESQNTSPKPMYPPLDPALLGYPLLHPMSSQQRPVHSYEVFPPQSATSHPLAFPPPPNYFPASQINPPLSYPQIPNYSPEMSSGKMPYHQPLVFPPPVTYEYQMKTLPVSTPIVFPPMFQTNDHQLTKTTDQTTTKEGGLDIFKDFGPQTQTPITATTQNINVTSENPNLQSQTERAATENPNSQPPTARVGTENPNPQPPTVRVATENPNPQPPTVRVATESPNPQPPAERVATGNTAEQPITNKNPTVQILPQSLVDGAITVASHAYSTAWNALNTFVPKEGETQTFDPVFENNMALLVDMGFRNMERNARLMKRYKNDINQVIGVICASPGGDNLEID